MNNALFQGKNSMSTFKDIMYDSYEPSAIPPRLSLNYVQPSL